MSSVSCHFCHQANPEASKFCNQCGSPLDLKPCPQCEAMNHVAVSQCHQCGTAFPMADASAIDEASPAVGDASAARDVVRAARTTAAGDSIPVALSTRIDAGAESAGAQRSGMASAAPLERSAAPYTGPAASPEPIGIPAADVRSPQWRTPRRSGAPYAALVGVAVCVIAGATYYAYEARLLPAAIMDWPRAGATKDAASSVTTSPLPATEMPASAGPATTTTPEAPNAATIAPAVRPPAAPPPGPAMAPAPRPQSATGTAQSRSAEPASAEQSPTANQSSRTAPLDASAPAASAGSAASDDTRASPRTARSTTRHGNAPSQADKDALATQRLIERDLKGFLPPEPPPDRGSRSP